MRGKALNRPGIRTRTFAALAAGAGYLAALPACSPSAIRVPVGEAETLRTIAVVPLEFQGITGQSRRYFHGGGDVVYVAGPRDNAAIGKEFRAVVVDGVPVIFEESRLGPGGPGQAERFEKLVMGPRERWLPAVDLAGIAARRLNAEGVEATVERGVVRIPGLTRRSPDGVPLDWWQPLNEWFGKDPDPLDLAGRRDRGARAVLVVAPLMVVPAGQGTQVRIFVKLVDPADGRVIGRAAADHAGHGSQSIDDFPSAFRSAAGPAVEKALRELGIVRPE